MEWGQRRDIEGAHDYNYETFVSCRLCHKLYVLMGRWYPVIFPMGHANPACIGCKAISRLKAAAPQNSERNRLYTCDHCDESYSLNDRHECPVLRRQAQGYLGALVLFLIVWLALCLR
jgi:hypothetical protein